MTDYISKNITALVLTWNEKENIARVLHKLLWLDNVIIIDSGSTDGTLDIIKNFANTKVYYRAFDNFADQCNYGVSLIKTPWILSIDADYVLTNNFIHELKLIPLQTEKKNVAYEVQFNFLIFGKSLSSNNTTARPVLFKNGFGSYYNDGHAHRLLVNGSTGRFKHKINHDDRKPLSRWLSNQDKYSLQESAKLLSYSKPHLSVTSRLRKNKILAPVFIFFYCLFIKGLIFNGWRGWHYTMQRTIAEMLISLRLIEASKLKYEDE